MVTALKTPVRYFGSIPPAIRLLGLGVFINQLGGYVTVFLALILAVRGYNSWHIGLALGLVAVSGIIGSSAGGVVASRIGTRWTIIATMAGSALFTALLAVGGPYPVQAGVACFIAVFNRGCVPAAIATVGDLAPADQRLPMFGFYQLAFNLGAAVGPLIAGFLLTRSLAALLLIDAATSALYAIAALWLPRREPHPAGDRRQRSGRVQRTVLADRRFLIICVAVGLVAMCYGQQSGAFPLELKEHHYSLELLGALFSANAVAVILFQVPASLAAKRLSVRLSLTAGAALICGGYAIFLFGMSLPTIIASVCLWTAGELLTAPVAPAVAMSMSTPESHSRYQGALSAARTAGQSIGPTAGVFASSVSASLPWWGCAVAGLAAVSIYLRLLAGVTLTGPRPAGARPQPRQPQDR